MKETINVNIGSQSFTLDYDAYQTLRTYLEDVQSRLGTDDQEVMNDIENRIAEIFREKTPSPMMVVTLAMAERAIARIGKPEDFGTENQSETKNNNGMGQKLLRRSRTDRSIAGVCGGLANYFDIDTTLLRILAVCLVLFAGMSLWVYIILWLLIPEE